MKHTKQETVKHAKSKVVSKLKAGFLLDSRYPELLLHKSFLLLAGFGNTYKTTLALLMIVNAVKQSVFDPCLKLKKVVTLVTMDLIGDDVFYRLLANAICGGRFNQLACFRNPRKAKRVVDNFFDKHGFILEIRKVYSHSGHDEFVFDSDIDIHHLIIDDVQAFRVTEDFSPQGVMNFAMKSVAARNKGVKILIAGMYRELLPPIGVSPEPTIVPARVVGVPNQVRYMSSMELHTHVRADGVWVSATRNLRGRFGARYRLIEA